MATHVKRTGLVSRRERIGASRLAHDARLLRDFVRRCALWIRHHGVRSSIERSIDVFYSRRSSNWRAYRNWTQQTPPAIDESAPFRAGDPLLSILCPVRDPEPALLDSLYRSLAGQRGARWELCLADDGSRSAAIRATIERLAARDPRVRHLRNHTSQGISAATNAAADLSRGDVLIFVDHDDELVPGVLARFAAAFDEDPELDLAYMDEDQITAWGLEIAPTFKPGPSPYLGLGFNYVGHPLAISRSLFETLGGLRSEFDGSQDHDLVLRAFEQARGILHLPGIGYHWRRARSSVSASSVTKDWAFERGRGAVEDACRRRGLPTAKIRHASPRGIYHIEPARRPVALACRVVLHGAPEHAESWRTFLSTQRDLLDVRGLAIGEWPKEMEREALLVVNAALAPSRRDLETLVAWFALPGVGAVAASGSAAGRWRNLGYSISQSGMAEPVLPGRRIRGNAPGLLTSAVREVAAAQGGLMVTSTPPQWLRARLASAPVAPEFELAFSLGAAVEEASMLFVPGCRPHWRRSALAARFGGPIDLRPTGVWDAIRRHLPADFWSQGSDRFCPRHPLLTPLGLPAPCDSPAANRFAAP